MNKQLNAMIDAAMVEMKNIHPPLKRSECERLICAALRAELGRVVEPVYGYCPECGYAGEKRERSPHGYTYCGNGHKWLSELSLANPPVQPASAPLTDDECREIYTSAMALPDRSQLSVMRFIERKIQAHGIGGSV